MRLTILLFMATLSAAKPMFNSPGEAILRSDLIVVGDVISGEKTRQGDFLDCRARIHALRILKGQDGLAGRELAVHWQYAPRSDQPSDLEPAIAPVHAIWFLKRNDNNSEYEAMWVDMFQIPMGGYLLPIPEESPSGTLSYAPDANYQTKVASELAAALMAIAAGGSARLDVVNRVTGTGPYILHWRSGRLSGTTSVYGEAGGETEGTRARTEFEAISIVFKDLDPAGIQAASEYLVQQKDIHLAVVGLLGQLRAKNLEALFVMEKLYPSLNVTLEAVQLATAAGAIDVTGNNAAIQAVGRMGVSETRVFGFTAEAANQLAKAQSRFGLPYLETMLLDREPNVSAVSARGICAEFASDADLRAIADSQLIDACQFRTVAANRIGNHSPGFGPIAQIDTNVLRAWLDAHAKEQRRFTEIDPPPPPSWFATPFGH